MVNAHVVFVSGIIFKEVSKVAFSLISNATLKPPNSKLRSKAKMQAIALFRRPLRRSAGFQQELRNFYSFLSFTLFLIEAESWN